LHQDFESDFPCYMKYKNLTELFENEVESLITHETLHIVLKRFRRSIFLDNIDQENEISGFHFLS